ncbi:MAG: hypothetical protein JNK82_21885, partial [Myxococcaceae bacterium]|nr:hypothetical protein [Myxococcaceae bacterium]
DLFAEEVRRIFSKPDAASCKHSTTPLVRQEEFVVHVDCNEPANRNWALSAFQPQGAIKVVSTLKIDD